MVDFSRDVHCLFGLPFDIVDMPAAVARVRSAIAGGAPCFLSTPNLNFLIASRTDAAFRDSVVNSDLCIADGAPLVWMSMIAGLPITERVAGSSLFDELRSDVSRPLKVYFFGGVPGVGELACQRLNSGPAGTRCVGFECPGFGSIEDMSGVETIEQINRSEADFLVVALGARKGQAWIVRNQSRLTVPVVSHLGAVINFVAGTVRRAPPWMRRVGLEWLWRIKEEPSLWRRYLQDGVQFAGLLITRVLPYAWHVRMHRPGVSDLSRAAVEAAVRESVVHIRLRGAWCRENIDPLRHCFRNAVDANKDIVLDLSGTTHVDSAFMGQLALMKGRQDRNGLQLRVDGVRPRVLMLFKLSCTEYILEDGAVDGRRAGRAGVSRAV